MLKDVLRMIQKTVLSHCIIPNSLALVGKRIMQLDLLLFK